MREWWSKLTKAVGGRRHLDDELREEIETHLAYEIQERISMGMTREQAQESALKVFGSTTLIRERARESWMFYMLETALQDLRYGLRTLGRNPGFAVAAVLSLALGIGANTALFGVFNAVMLRMLPVRRPEQLMLLTWSSKAWPGKVVDDVEGSVDRDKKTGLMTSSSLSSDCYEYLRRNTGVFSDVIAFASNDERVNLGLGGGAEDGVLQAVSGDYFRGLGVPALVGRVLEPGDDRPAAPLAVVVSHAFWQKQLGGDKAVAGTRITINGTPATVVGVVAPEFLGVDPGQSPDLYVPLGFAVEQSRRVYDYDLRQPKAWWLTVMGRLKSGVGQEQARAELSVLFRRHLESGSPSTLPDSNLPWLQLTPAGRGLSGLREEFATALPLLMAMVGLVLLIACANVAGLLLARATSRQREICVRASLGAPRLRIVRQLMTESILLGILGGIAGMLLAKWVGSSLVGLFAAVPGRPLVLSIQADARVFAFSAGISILSGVLFGLAVALRAGRVEVYPALRQMTDIHGTAGSRFHSGKILVGAQVALCLLLLTGAGLLVSTLRRLQAVDVGFDCRHLLLFKVQPGKNGYKGTGLAGYYQGLEQRLTSLPGVQSVGISQRGPVCDGWSQGRVVLPGYTPAGESVPFYRHWISPGFFGTLGIPLVLGRVIGPQDSASAPRVVVVNQKFVRDYFHDQSPIGHKFDAGSLKAEIVGVVADTKYGNLRSEPPPTAYLSYLQYPRDYPASMTFEVRSKEDPGSVITAVRRETEALDKAVPAIDVRTGSEVIDKALSLERAFALLSSSFGFLALLLACVGLYGTMSYTVAQRTSELGIRMALGAPRNSILTMVLREALLIVIAGIAVGLPLAWIGTRLLESWLFGLSPHDPVTIVLAVAAILVVTVGAGSLPAFRASRVDPILALRCE